MYKAAGWSWEESERVFAPALVRRQPLCDRSMFPCSPMNGAGKCCCFHHFFQTVLSFHGNTKQLPLSCIKINYIRVKKKKRTFCKRQLGNYKCSPKYRGGCIFIPVTMWAFWESGQERVSGWCTGWFTHRSQGAGAEIGSGAKEVMGSAPTLHVRRPSCAAPPEMHWIFFRRIFLLLFEMRTSPAATGVSPEWGLTAQLQGRAGRGKYACGLHVMGFWRRIACLFCFSELEMVS